MTIQQQGVIGFSTQAFFFRCNLSVALSQTSIHCYVLFFFFFFSSSFERELFWASHLDGNRSKLGKTKVPPDSCCFDVGLIRKPERQLPER